MSQRDVLPAGERGNGVLDRLERAGRIMSVYGNTIMLLLFIGFFTGWLPSPLLRTTEGIASTLHVHDARVTEVIARQVAADERAAGALTALADQMRRQTNVLKLSVCAALRDPEVRRTCLRE